MNIVKSFRNLSKFETMIWCVSIGLILLSFAMVRDSNELTVIASLVGATALIFVGKGDALGQFLTLVFSILYAIISYQFRYYGEMITYIGMTAPTAFIAMVNWLKHPYQECEVEVRVLSRKHYIFLAVSAVLVTGVLGFVLKVFHTANLPLSIISITTSYLASMLMVLRSQYYAAAYAANDIILICLWILATLENSSYMPMIICFLIFLVNDIYGFINWRRIQKRQEQ